jgi:hypothetical protein
MPVSYIKHKGRDILYVDLTESKSEKRSLELLEETKNAYLAATGKIRVLVNSEGAYVNSVITSSPGPGAERPDPAHERCARRRCLPGHGRRERWSPSAPPSPPLAVVHLPDRAWRRRCRFARQAGSVQGCHGLTEAASAGHSWPGSWWPRSCHPWSP